MVGLLEHGTSSSQGLYVHTEHKDTQISVPRVGFETTAAVFDGTKAVYTLCFVLIVIGASWFYIYIYLFIYLYIYVCVLTISVITL
jgi:hypothetical protein